MRPISIFDRTLQFSVDVILAFRGEKFSIELDITRKQVIRSATSIGANVIEARHASSRKEFLRYLEIALRSSHETEYWLTLCQRLSILDKPKSLRLCNEASQLSRILASMILTTKSRSKAEAEESFQP